ncbi:MAG: hypothetical protein AAF560_26420 [Acidobacteriota bacterium]
MRTTGLRWRRPILTGRFVALVAALAFTATAVDALPRAKDRWLRLETEHFTLISNANERSTRQVATELETFLAALGGLLGRAPASPLPSTVYVFKNDSAFKPYKLLWEGKPANVAGFYLERTDGNLIAVNGDRRLEASGILYHELMHYVMSSNFSPVPVWVGEGLAELYSTFEVDDDRVYIGKPVEGHVFWLRDHALIPLAELFAIDTDSPSYNEGTRQGSFYAQSWLLIHYMLLSDDEQRRDRFMRFLGRLGHGANTEQAFREVFARDYEALETELRRYARQSKFYYQTLPAPSDAGKIGDTHELTRTEALCWLGDLLISQPGREAEAEEHFRLGIQRNPKAGDCHIGMGRVMEQRGDARAAEAHFQRATELEPESFVAWYQWGVLRIQAEQASGVAPATRAALERSVELQPSFGPAWAALSYAYTFEDTVGTAAIRAGERAHALLPAEAEVAQNLLLHYARGSQPAAAQQLFARFFAGHPDPDVTRSAQIVLWHLEAQEAEALIPQTVASAEHISAALAEFERIRAASAGAPEMAWLDERIQGLRQFLDEQRLIDRYNQAVELLNACSLAEGRRLLEEIVAADPQGEFGNTVRSTLKQVQAIPTP